MSAHCGAAFIENMGVYFHTLRNLRVEKVLEFDIGRTWKVLEFEMSKCIYIKFIYL